MVIDMNGGYLETQLFLVQEDRDYVAAQLEEAAGAAATPSGSAANAKKLEEALVSNLSLTDEVTRLSSDATDAVFPRKEMTERLFTQVERSQHLEKELWSCTQQAASLKNGLQESHLNIDNLSAAKTLYKMLLKGWKPVVVIRSTPPLLTTGALSPCSRNSRFFETALGWRRSTLRSS